MKIIFSLLLVSLLATVFFGCFTTQGESTDAIPAVSGLDLGKYMGKWYEIARLPHRFERDMTDVSANYELRPDGKINVVNSGNKKGKWKEIRGIAQTAAGFPAGTGELEVSFFRPFYGKYRIIYLEPDYSAAVVTSDTKKYFWILAREPELPPERLKEYIDFAKRLGFETDLLEYPNRQDLQK